MVGPIPFIAACGNGGKEVLLPIRRTSSIQPHISPDDRWIVFGADANSPNPESALYVVLRLGWSVDAHHRRPALGRQAPLVS